MKEDYQENRVPQVNQEPPATLEIGDSLGYQAQLGSRDDRATEERVDKGVRMVLLAPQGRGVNQANPAQRVSLCSLYICYQHFINGLF